jgi:hypothetical protein
MPQGKLISLTIMKSFIRISLLLLLPAAFLWWQIILMAYHDDKGDNHYNSNQKGIMERRSSLVIMDALNTEKDLYEYDGRFSSEIDKYWIASDSILKRYSVKINSSGDMFVLFANFSIEKRSEINSGFGVLKIAKSKSILNKYLNKINNKVSKKWEYLDTISFICISEKPIEIRSSDFDIDIFNNYKCPNGYTQTFHEKKDLSKDTVPSR